MNLLIRATARLVTDPDETRQLWNDGVLPYDPSMFFSGPEDPETQFIEFTPTVATIHPARPRPLEALEPVALKAHDGRAAARSDRESPLTTVRSMANEAMKENWVGGGERWAANERLIDSSFTEVTEAIVTAADLGGATRVLDIGCGTGTLLAAVVAAGAEAVGVDISSSMVEAAARRVPEATVVVGRRPDRRPAGRGAGRCRSTGSCRGSG